MRIGLLSSRDDIAGAIRTNREPVGLGVREKDTQDKESQFEAEILEIVQTFDGLDYLISWLETNLKDEGIAGFSDIQNLGVVHQFDWKDLKDEPMGEQERQSIEEWGERYGTFHAE